MSNIPILGEKCNHQGFIIPSVTTPFTFPTEQGPFTNFITTEAFCVVCGHHWVFKPSGFPAPPPMQQPPTLEQKP